MVFALGWMPAPVSQSFDARAGKGVTRIRLSLYGTHFQAAQHWTVDASEVNPASHLVPPLRLTGDRNAKRGSLLRNAGRMNRARAENPAAEELYKELKGVQLTRHSAGNADGDTVTVPVDAITDRGLTFPRDLRSKKRHVCGVTRKPPGELAQALLVLACQYDEECKNASGMPRLCVSLPQRDRAKVQELMALVQPCRPGEYVTGEELMQFIGLLCKQTG